MSLIHGYGRKKKIIRVILILQQNNAGESEALFCFEAIKQHLSYDYT